MLALGKRKALYKSLNKFYIRILSQNALELANISANSCYSSSSSSSKAVATHTHTSSSSSSSTAIPNDGLTLNHFINQSHSKVSVTTTQYQQRGGGGGGGSVFIETYGCQMNISDSEVINSVLENAGYSTASSAETADVVLLNTCAIRDNAESKIWQRLGYLKNMKLERKNAAKRKAVAVVGTMGVSGDKSSVSTTGDNRTIVPTNPNAGPVVGVLGCMAERLKIKLLESDRLVDLVAGPDAYRDLPRLIHIVDGGVSSEKARKNRKIIDASRRKNISSAPATTSAASTTNDLKAFQEEKEELSYARFPYNAAINVQLSIDETYADVIPVRPAGATSVFLSIMRGCNNMCSFCVVPFTRGRERSRPMQSILDEVQMLSDQGVREITLLGQNVNSYADFSRTTNSNTTTTNHSLATPSLSSRNDSSSSKYTHYAKGFQSVYRPQRHGATTFAELLAQVSDIDSEMRIRFTSPHPKEFSDDVLRVLRSRDNVCKQVHMPAQSGSSAVLERMKRGYTRDAYDALVEHIRSTLPGVALSTDMIAGFCEESQSEHEESVDLLKKVQYDSAFLFAYSRREKTHAARKYIDNVPQEVKIHRLTELIDTYRDGVYAKSQEEIGRRHLVLVEGKSRKNENQLTGRTDTFKRVVFQNYSIPFEYTKVGEGWYRKADDDACAPLVQIQAGDYVAVQIVQAGGGTLQAIPLGRTSIKQFVNIHGSAVPLEKYDSL